MSATRMGTRFHRAYDLILGELHSTLAAVDAGQLDALLAAICRARGIFVVGAGRMGILLSTFCMRLNHLGFASHVVGSATCPPISSEDLLIVASSSGETATTREVTMRAAGEHAAIAVFTAAPTSTIGRLASHLVWLRAPSSLCAAAEDAPMSRQPMKTLFEQTLFLVLESLVLVLLEHTGQDASDMSRRHGNLE